MRLRHDAVLFEYAGIPMVGNPENGGTIGLTPGGKELCERMRVSDVPDEEAFRLEPELAQCLSEAGFIRDVEVDRGEGRLTSAYLHVTQRCNLSCRGCYSDGPSRNAGGDASTEDMKTVVGNLAHAGVRNLVVSGGEPLLRDDLDEILRYAKECGIESVSVLTNGTLVEKDAVTRLAPFVDCISVSFDGCSPESPAHIRGTQRFAELVKAVGTIKDAGVEAHMIATVHAKNADDVPAYVALSEELGATLNFSMLSCGPDDGLASLVPDDGCLRSLGCGMVALAGSSVGTEDVPVGPSLSVKKVCGAGCKTLSVDADGSVYPCHMLHVEQYRMGNAITGTVEEALQSDVAALFAALDASDFDGCAGCRYLPLCGGGCRARSFFFTGDVRAKDPYCAMTTGFYDAFAGVLASAVASQAS